MSKRNKRFASKRSGLKLEQLEQRQLLATIVGGEGTGGISVSNAQDVLIGTTTFDQVLMDDASITVDPDEGQSVRVDFLDEGGDLVRVSYSGPGQLTINLSNFGEAAEAEGLNIPGILYVSGNAEIYITGSDATSNVLISSLGPVNAFLGEDNPIFSDGATLGDDSIANVQRIVIEGAHNNPLGSEFGSIFAGNAVFSADKGAVGIIAPNVQVTGTITIGDLDADGTATPILIIGEFSDTDTITVAGGDLEQSNDELIITDGSITKLVSASGQTSAGVLLETQVIDGTVFEDAIAEEDISFTSAIGDITIAADVTQEELDEYANKFLNNVTIEGTLEGLVFAARQFGDIVVEGDLAGLITTDVEDDGDSAPGELSIGNVTIGGDILAGGAIESSAAIGNITVVGGIDYSEDTLEELELEDFEFGEYLDGDQTVVAIISTLGRDTASAKIGNITFGGDIDLGVTGVALVVGAATGDADSAGVGNITANSLNSEAAASSVISTLAGDIGDITIEEDLVITGSGDEAIIAFDGSVGAITAADIEIDTEIVAGDGDVGLITSTDGDIDVLAVIAADGDVEGITADGSLLAVFIGGDNVGDLTSGDEMVLFDVLSVDGDIGNITSGDALDIVGDITSDGDIGDISSGGDLTVDGDITAADGSIGNISADGGDLEINGTITAENIGDISAIADGAAGGNIDVNNMVEATDGSIGDIMAEGDDADVILTFTAGGGFLASEGIGDVTVDNGSILGVDGQVEFSAASIGDVTVVGGDTGATLLTDVIFAATDGDIGDIELDASDDDGAIAESTTPSTTAVTGTGFSAFGNIGDITLTTSDDGSILVDGGDSLIFRAGNSAMGADAEVEDDGANEDGGVSIGDVTISANLTADISDQATLGTGLVIASGVDLNAAGEFIAGDGADLITPDKMGDGGDIGDVFIQDLAGTVTVNGFTSNTLPEDAATAHANGAVIVGNTIATVVVQTGIEILDIVPTGLALKGVIGVGVDALTDYDFAETRNLFVVVL